MSSVSVASEMGLLSSGIGHPESNCKLESSVSSLTSF